MQGHQFTAAKVDKAKLRLWLQAGVTPAECARQFGCSRQRICQLMHKLGMALQPKSAPKASDKTATQGTCK